ncbi:protein RRP5 homolog [Triplophysa rosa]|uniref:Protein RRP5 homolog n=1 Tax=Triplophysa rosa TaxID=992332 RepID=A0A9W7WZA3_TRIRA|nr:protein RRP5 homolog [Triplophysa rosa]XP_057187348.1 protein RRP5 homolog [Triplophysa rosa]KAI7811133.1 protein RRP5-like protein [Triplophysa rosa]
MEADFPRGGTQKSSVDKSVKSHEVDNLFQTQEPVVKKKRKTVKQDDGENFKKHKVDDRGLKLNTADGVEILHFLNLKVGTLLLGCVREVSDLEAVVGLPSGLVGYLPIRNICDAYTKILIEQLESLDSFEEVVTLSELLTPGTLVRCVVSSLNSVNKGQISLKLSINPKEVNKCLSAAALKPGMTLSGCVESVEDHGFLVDIGINGTKAFLPKKSTSTKQDLKVGQYVLSLIEEVKNEGRVVRLSLNPQAVNKAVAGTQQGWTLDSLLPGLLIRVHIKRVTPHGLVVEYLSSFSGTVDFLHIDQDKASCYKSGNEVLARVLYIEPSSRAVALSLRSHLLPPGGSVLGNFTSEQIGEVVQGCKMTAVHHHSGALMELPDGTKAFVHRKRMKEPKEEFNASRLLAKPEHNMRITDYSPMEQIHMASLRKSNIEATFFRYQDIQVGQIIEATVISLQKLGMFVRVTDHIKGMIPRNHLADVVLTNPEKKFHEGMKLKCRVLSVDEANKRLLLTRKKALIESRLPIIQSYSDARVGRVAHGSIMCVKKYGCIVRFYGEVKGLVPVQEMSTEHVTDPEDLFFVGQVVKAKVIKCNAESEKLVLSFKAVTEVDVIQTQTAQFDFEIGKTVDVRVSRKVLDGLEVSVLPEEIPAFLPTVHLSDHVTNCLLLWDALEEGDNISDVVCLNKNKRGINLTKKPSLKACLEDGNVPTGFSELQVGMQMVGWVKNIMPYGVFIDFPRGLFGLAPKAAMCEQFITDTSNVFTIGQTVVAKVTNLDEEKNRFLVSLKVSELNLSEEDAHARLIQGQKERKAIIEMVTCRGESDLLEQLSSVSVGDKIKMVVEDVKEDGTVTLTSDRLSEAIVLASKHHTTGVNTTPGCKLTAVVLHVDPLKSQVLVSLLPTLTRKRKSLSNDSEHAATIQYIDKDFAVVSLGDTGHLTIIPAKTQLNDVVDLESFSVGSCLNVIVKDPSREELGGLPLVACKGQDQQVKSKSKAQMHSLGVMVTAKVTKLKPLGVLVMLPSGTTGHIHVSEIEESPVVGSLPTSSLKVGAEVQAKVIGGHTVRGNRFLPVTHPNFKLALPELTILPRKLEGGSMQTVDKLKHYKPGHEVICFPSKYDKQLKCLEVHVKSNIMGTVELLAMISKPGQANNPQKLFKPGQAVLAKVVGNNPSRTGQLSLSLTGIYKLEQGSVTMGMVWKIEPHRGLFVKLPFGNSGLVSLMDLSDEYSDNPLEPYKEGQVIRCCIIGEEKGHFNVSLRTSRTNKVQQEKVTDPEIQSISDIKEGQIVRGYVKTVGVSGIFVRLSRSLEGRVQLQHATKYYINKPEVISKHVTQNALVTAKVLSVDTENIHVSLSLLTKDTGKSDILPESLKLPSRLPEDKKKTHNRTKRKRVSSESQQQDEKKHGKKAKKNKASTVTEERVDKKKAKKEDSDSGVEVFFREEDDDEPNKECEKKNPKEPERLQISWDFSWDTTLSSLTPAAVDQVYESSEDEEEDQSKPVKKTRKELQQEQQNAEQQLSKLEAELMDPSVRPDNATAFERLLLSSPDSSFLWLQYMAFHLQATQIEQARAVAERALKTISFREEQEKLNIWVAMLNLENMYGTEESLQKVFERAIQYCEPLPVYQQLADIYAKSDKLKEAESLYKSMVKRFRQEKAVYESYGNFLLRQGQSNAANALLQRALQSLSNKDHVDLITKFARLEFQYGNTERAKSMFDKVLGTYSKRTDLWSVFIDLMVKHGSQKEVREIFDRVIHLSVSVKKIKFFFKRYLEYEKKHGTPESIQAVKQKALEYVESKGADAAS